MIFSMGTVTIYVSEKNYPLTQGIVFTWCIEKELQAFLDKHYCNYNGQQVVELQDKKVTKEECNCIMEEILGSDDFDVELDKNEAHKDAVRLSKKSQKNLQPSNKETSKAYQEKVKNFY